MWAFGNNEGMEISVAHTPSALTGADRWVEWDDSS